MNRQQMNALYPAYIVPPISIDISKIIRKYAGKVVKAKSGKPPVYLIHGGKKRHFTSENALNLCGISINQYIEIPDNELHSIPDGKNINLTDLKKPMVELVKRNNIKI